MIGLLNTFGYFSLEGSSFVYIRINAITLCGFGFDKQINEVPAT